MFEQSVDFSIRERNLERAFGDKGVHNHSKITLLRYFSEQFHPK